ncbi:hypothetical protein HUJ04_005589 [Dendroctonus ponderosae]|nr:hypothetical protein HUJ04_005589 [Dendroctonus ponderosae]
MRFSKELRMPSRNQGHVVTSMPQVRMSGAAKFTYGVLMSVVIVGPLIATISFIPYMRDKKGGG